MDTGQSPLWNASLVDYLAFLFVFEVIVWYINSFKVLLFVFLMLGIDEYLDEAKRMGICSEGLNLISGSYEEGERDGANAHQSCLPLEIVKSNLIRNLFLKRNVNCLKEWSSMNRGGKLVELMARAYYDAFNMEVVERGILSSEYFRLE